MHDTEMVLAKALEKKPISGLRKKMNRLEDNFSGTLQAHWETGHEYVLASQENISYFCPESSEGTFLEPCISFLK